MVGRVVATPFFICMRVFRRSRELFKSRPFSAASRQALIVYGANTDVGKTLACAGLVRQALSDGRPTLYIKPVQTGPEKDADFVLKNCVGNGIPNSTTTHEPCTATLFHYTFPESPASAAIKDGVVPPSDAELRAAVEKALRVSESTTSPDASCLCLIETAGGPLSPAPSANAQADAYAPLGLPCVLVGDSRLGGISATLCAAESLAARKQPACVVLFLGASGEHGNAEAVQVALASAGHSARVVSVPAPPPMPEPLGSWFEDPGVKKGMAEVLREVSASMAAGQISRETIQEHVAFDRKHLWHPYTSMAKPGRVWSVRAASGCEFELSDGRRLIDGMASWWCAVHGYNVPELNAAATRQLSLMSHVMFGGLTHRPATELGSLLVGCAPQGLSQVFLCDSGSVSVEVALKMALQYWAMQGRPGKSRIATVRRGYHGDTFGAMAVCDPERGMHSLFRDILPQHLFADPPTMTQGGAFGNEDDGFASMEILLRNHHEEVAAVIIEPVVQGAGGMRIYHPSYLRKLRHLCDELQVLLIFDEIATGFGRTGRLFAAEHAGVSPDIMCIGKALTGGYCTLGATLASEEVGRGASGGGTQPLMHGPTFMANPLACAVAAASIRLLLAGPWQERVAAIDAQLRRELAPVRALECVEDVRVLGAIGVVELRAPPQDPASLQAAFVDRGVWLRPFGRLVYTMPPYIISENELGHLTTAIFEVLSGGVELDEGAV